jgi:hypothetical protein
MLKEVVGIVKQERKNKNSTKFQEKMRGRRLDRQAMSDLIYAMRRIMNDEYESLKNQAAYEKLQGDIEYGGR